MRPANTLLFDFATEQEAKKRGITYDPPPPSIECPLCGKELLPQGVVRDRRITRWFLPYCECPEAKAERERQSEKEIHDIIRAGQEQAKQAKISQMIEGCGMKKRFMNRTFENFDAMKRDQMTAYTMAKNYARDFEENKEDGQGLYFFGSNGTGKTHLAAAICLDLMPKGVGVVFRTFAGLLGDIKDTFDSDRSETEVIKAYTDADLLIIDDLGKEQCTDWAISQLYTIVNNRYEDCKPIVITANYSFEELERVLVPKGYNDDKVMAIVSRLRETCKPVPMYWQDRRREDEK